MNRIVIILLFVISISCSSKKGYEDYDKNDFYEVQGIITSVERTRDATDYTNLKNIEYEYFLMDSIKLKGKENSIGLVGLFQGAPIVILVHKNDKDISFYGYNGTVDSLSYGERFYMKNYLGKIIESEK